MMRTMRRLLQCDRHSRLRRPGVARPGQSLVIAALSFTVLMGMVALGVDIGNLWLQQRMLRTIADGAALVGAQGYDAAAIGSWPVTSAGLDAAKNYAEMKAGVACGFGTGAIEPCKIISPVAAYGGQGDQYIQVIIRKTVPFSFARVLGFASQDLTLTSTARTNRPQPSDFALIALGNLPGNSIRIQQADSPDTRGNYRITGSDVAAYGGISEFGGSAGTAYIVNGQAYFEAGNPVTASVNPVPIPQGGMPTVAPDPFIGFGWPAAPSSNCNDNSLNTPTEVFSGSPIVGNGDNVLFNPGCYSSIIIQGGTARFKDGIYRIAGNFNADVAAPPPSPSQIAEMRMETPLLSSNGAYFLIEGGLTISRNIRFQLKGHRNYRDVLFRSTSTTGAVFITNLYNSNLLGTIYAPNVEVHIRGNACDALNAPSPLSCQSDQPSARVTRGRDPLGVNPPLTQRGGQVIGRTIRLILARSTADLMGPWAGDSWGVDYPPINTNRQPAPTLIPNAP